MTTPTDRRKLFALLAIAVLGASYPLTDPDLPLHLLIGEWIVQHRAVPFVEPFAWTRPGEPYFAYSWLPQIIFYGVERLSGAAGLRIMHGLLSAGAAAAMISVSKAAGWTRPVTLVMVALHVAAFGIAVPSLRPQGILFITVPLAWASVLHLVVEPRSRRSLALLFASSAISAASHIFFPLTAVPLAALAIANSAVRTTVKATIAVVAGWLVSPYALRWIEVFVLNFSPNAMLGPRSPIIELRPGFSLSGESAVALLFVVAATAAVAWGMLRMPFSVRARVTALILLVVGVGGFAFANRLIVVFWLLVAPLVGHVLALWMDRGDRVIAIRVAGVLAVLFVIASALHPRHLGAWTEEGFVSPSLAWPHDARAAPAVRQFECVVRMPERARIFTRMRYANVLAWRLRPHSMSIDTRTIFPDSVTRSELADGRIDTTVWRHADVAVLDPLDRMAPALDAAPGWIAVSPPPDADSRSPSIWLNANRFDFGEPALREPCAAAGE